MKVRKRDGRIVEFNPDNIKYTIQCAAQAVENKELDFQDRRNEYENLVADYVKEGYLLEEAIEEAEDQIDGYMLDGVYTEFDSDEADNVVDIIVESLDNAGLEVVDVSVIQDAIESALIMTGHAKTAREYIARRSQRDNARSMNSGLMKCFEKLTFKNSIDNDTKRENANIDGDSAMGTMLKYGSESAKEFNLLHLVSPEIADAHRNGDIHIHDLDFMALTETCVSGDTLITIKKGDRAPVTVEAQWFDTYLDKYDDDTVVNLEGLKILSKGQFVELKNCVRHSSKGKRVLKISTGCTDITVTSEHRIPVIRNNEEILVHADEIQVGDLLLRDEPNNNNVDKTVRIGKIEDIEYSGYVYDFETENHYFSANGVTVHNCVQIDLLKLFKDGFNTGHGFLREPQDIRTAGALACIAIQSSQNDQHSVA